MQRIDLSPVVELNRAVAVAMRDGPEAGLVLIDAILKRGDLVDYHLAHAARAELCRRSGKMSEAKNSYVRALSLARQEPERRFLSREPSEFSFLTAISDAKCVGNRFLAKFWRPLSIREILVRLLVKVGK